MKILAYMEVKDNKLLPACLELLTAVCTLGEAQAVVVNNAAAAQQAAQYGVPVTVLKSGDNCPDAQIAALEHHIKTIGAEIVLFSASQLGKDLAPRLAQRFNGGCVTDVTAIEAGESGVLFTRPAYGGSLIENIRLDSSCPQFATLRGGSFAKPVCAQEAAVTEVEIEIPVGQLYARVVEAAREIADAVDLEGAEVIVTGGRGMGNAENFKLVEELAALLGGVVGASRPVIEEGWVSRAHQIGQSGKIVAPRLYIACGVSGAMQHMSGVLGAKYIVAINKDVDAPIFSVADLSIVGDVKVILPLLIEQLRGA